MFSEAELPCEPSCTELGSNGPTNGVITEGQMTHSSIYGHPSIFQLWHEFFNSLLDFGCGGHLDPSITVTHLPPFVIID
jgi:hypothetical protein